MTAYAFFVQTCREEHKKKHPEENVVFAEFSKKCAERWKVRGFWCMFYFKATTEKRFFFIHAAYRQNFDLKERESKRFQGRAERSNCGTFALPPQNLKNIV